MVYKNNDEKEIVYVDMDDTICEYTKARFEALRNIPTQAFPQAQFDFFRKLEPIPGAIEALNILNTKYDVWILTRPSVPNPWCYTEKRLWIEDHMGLDWCHKLILCPDKALMIGNYLIDDVLWSGFRGTQILFNKDGSNNWDFVTEYLMSKDEI